jgi:hypothetical protein
VASCHFFLKKHSIDMDWAFSWIAKGFKILKKKMMNKQSDPKMEKLKIRIQEILGLVDFSNCLINSGLLCGAISFFFLFLFSQHVSLPYLLL